MIADARPDNWVDRHAPEAWRPYLKLARADRPIGVWLLFWPCAWGAAAAGDPWPNLWHMVLFALGAWLMRGAGCAFNDIVDRDLDAKVQRTALRPLASGALSLPAAIAFMIALALAGLIVLLQFNAATILLGIASLAPVAIYPFMKRITWWPQAFLGIAFNWGALVGVSAARGGLDLTALALYGAGIAWTIGYDTIYAHQDREDDALIGIKSSARALGAATKPALIGFYGLAVALLILVGWLEGLGLAYALVLAAVAAHLAWQVIALNIDQPALCLHIFKSNRWTGALIFLSLLIGKIAS